jgi:hypothetical protein
MAEELVDFRVASRRLRCSIRHVQRLTDEGQLQSVRDARGIEFVVGSSLAAYEKVRAEMEARFAKRSDPPDDPAGPPE